jgi:thiocyanate hydrolase subunit beta
MESHETAVKPAQPRFKVGDRVRVKDAPNIFYSRTQMYVRGVSGVIAFRAYESQIPEDEAFDRDDALPQQFYVVRFRQKDLWREYPFENDTLQTELPEGWLEPCAD